jgi:hypothetical protein
MKRIVFYFEEHYKKKIPLLKAASYFLHLSQKTEERFFVSEKT